MIDVFSNPHRIPLMPFKEEWEKEFLEERILQDPEMLVRWKLEMTDDALVSFREELKLRDRLLYDYASHPYDMGSLFIRENIKMLQRRYPTDVVEYFYGNWDRYNDLERDIKRVDENISLLSSQKHLEDWLGLKESLEKEQFQMGILIGHLQVPRIRLEREHLPFDFDDNFMSYQKPREASTFLPPKKRSLQCREKLPPPNMDPAQNWMLRIDDPHRYFYEMTTKFMDIDEDFLPDFPLSSPSKKIKTENK